MARRSPPPRSLTELIRDRVSEPQGERGCRLWQGHLNDLGYGTISYTDSSGKKRNVKAHRAVYAVHHGIDVSEVPYLRHSCDNPPCCHLEHLVEGDHPSNMRDLSERRRWGNQTAKLSYEVAARIRREYKPGEVTMQQLADTYGVGTGTISMIVHNQIWKESNLG